MIGLVDYDLCSASDKVKKLIPNLEIMKLATYYKLEENIFCRLIDLNETNLNGYSKIFFFSEGALPPHIPPQFLRASNVEYGGTAFTNGTYIPFKNEVIDYTLPKTFIYKEFLKQKYLNGTSADMIAHVLDDTYYRIYAGNNKLPLPAIYPNKRIFIYDKDIFYSGWKDIIQEIEKRKPSNIYMIHPIVCKTLGNYFELRSIKKVARENDFILDINIPLDEVHYMLKHYTSLFLADVVKNSNVFLPLGGNYNTNLVYFKDFIYKLNLLYSFWSKGIMMKIKFIEPSPGYNNPIINLSIMTEKWSRNRFKKNASDASLDDNIILKTKITEAQKEKEFLLKFFPNANNLFIQNFQHLKTQGGWYIR